MKKTLLFISALAIGASSYAQYQGFENWTTSSIDWLDDYDNMAEERGLEGALAIYPSNDARTGSFSVRLETVISPMVGDTIFGFYASGDAQSLTPGQSTTPFNGVDSIIGYYKYDIQVGDSCSFIVGTSFMGTPTGGGTFYISSGVQSTWKRFSYPINSIASDSLLLAAATGDPLNNFNGIAGTWIQFDDIELKKGSQVSSIVNGGFENWTPLSWEEPTDWKTSLPFALDEPILTVVKSTDKYGGSFALELNTIADGDTIGGLATNGDFDDDGFMGGAPYSSNPTGVEFYYKNTLSGVDTSWASIEFKNGGSVFLQAGAELTPAANYTLYSQALSLSMTPDTLLFGFFSGENPGSQLIVDQFVFSFPVGVTENLTVDQLVAYPNPTTDQIKIRFELKNASDVNIRILNALGQEFTTRSLGNIETGTYRETFNTSGFAKGNYFIEFSLNNEKSTHQFVIK